MPRIIIIALLALALVGCSGASFIPDGDPATTGGVVNNSFGCLDGMYSGSYINGNIQGKRLRFPEGYDVTQLSAEQLENLARILCD